MQLLKFPIKISNYSSFTDQQDQFNKSEQLSKIFHSTDIPGVEDTI